ncbi:sigma-70 family RNA polymerase sigma factor [Pigmentiphaga aceris]|uniref:Sigma-70 family RNA polymerase sigma factor n=1 Tax=Pigmentiphaga aceris TaxID=1940612 RepID=A0A5C0B589_9BURK|nr:sigma-70 family RNA polymerase sigma factor [Pigmentiphaga aceris]QEI09405.1 sigma-70 family RNA polymerase sigma factor [Pigmentiphaga aceris]
MVARYYRELLNFLFRAVRDRHTAADLAQESYARVLAAEQRGQKIHDPRALLYRTARNLVVDQHRRADVRGEVLDTAADEAFDLDAIAGSASLQPEQILASREGLASVLATIDQLPPRCREAFILFKFDGLSYAEIASRMGISVRTVEMQLQIAMDACWQCFDQLEGRPDDAPAPIRRGRSRS